MKCIKCVGFFLLVSSVQVGADALIYRIADEGKVISYDSLAAFESNTQSTNITSPTLNYNDDGWFYYASRIYRTDDTGAIYVYDSVANFLTNTKGNGGAALATHQYYGADEWFTYDRGDGLKIYQVTDGGHIAEYDTIQEFIADTGSNIDSLFSGATLSDYANDGYFTVGSSIFRVGNETGRILEYTSWDNFQNGISVDRGIASGSYSNDGWFAVPEPASMLMLALGGGLLGLIRRFYSKH